MNIFQNFEFWIFRNFLSFYGILHSETFVIRVKEKSVLPALPNFVVLFTKKEKSNIAIEWVRRNLNVEKCINKATFLDVYLKVFLVTQQIQLQAMGFET